MRYPTLQHPLEEQVTSSQELCPTRDFLQTHLEDPDFFWFASDAFLKKPVLLKTWLLRSFFYNKSQAKSSTKKGLHYAPEEPAKSTFKCLILDTLRWHDVMSTSLKNPKESKKGMLSDQPWLSRITSTAFLGSWGQQLLEDKTPFGTDFETHTSGLGYAEEPAAKETVARNTRTSASSKAGGMDWKRITCKEYCGNPAKAVIG